MNRGSVRPTQRASALSSGPIQSEPAALATGSKVPLLTGNGDRRLCEATRGRASGREDHIRSAYAASAELYVTGTRSAVRCWLFIALKFRDQ